MLNWYDSKPYYIFSSHFPVLSLDWGIIQVFWLPARIIIVNRPYWEDGTGLNIYRLKIAVERKVQDNPRPKK